MNNFRDGNRGGGSNGNGAVSNGSRVQHERHEPTRLVNRFQPGHKFLEQLSTKSPMSLVNEIGRYHNFKPEYSLLDITGPPHAKKYSGNVIVDC